MAGKGALWIAAYGAVSIASFGVTLVSLASRAFDYLTLMHELTDSFKLTILLNFVVCCFLLGGIFSIRILFGELKIIEVEKIADQLPFYGLNLLFILFNDDNLLLNILWAGITVIAKIYHIIVLNRLDFVQLRVVNSLARESFTPLRIFRIFSMNLYVLLLQLFIVCDLVLAKVLAYDIFQGVSSMGSLLFGIQFGVMGIEGFTYCGKLILNVYELMFYRCQPHNRETQNEEELDDLDVSDDEDNSEIVWENKAIYTQSFEIIASGLKAAFYSIFIYILYFHSGLAPPIPIIQGFFFAVVGVIKQILQLKAYITQSRILDNLLANATHDELEAADYLCIICREDMHSPEVYEAQRGKSLLPRRCPKKLQCGHILHMGCLKDWLERSDNCPLCRKKVFGPSIPAHAETRGLPPEAEPVHRPEAPTQTGTAFEEPDVNPNSSVERLEERQTPFHRFPHATPTTIPPDWIAFPIARYSSEEFSIDLSPSQTGILRKFENTTTEIAESQVITDSGNT